MLIENPSVIVDKSGVVIDFLPVKEDTFVKFNLDDEMANGQKINIEREEYKRAIKYFRLVKLNYDFKIPQDCKWYMGKEGRAIFWEVFEENYKYCKNGLNIFSCDFSDWRFKICEGGWQCSGSPEENKFLQKLKSLKSKDEYKELKYTMEEKIGNTLYNYILMTNWIEWLQIVWSLNDNRIAFAITVPEPNLTEKDVRIMLPALELSAKMGMEQGFKNIGKDKEAKLILDAVQNIRKEEKFNPREVLENLVRMHWKLWPWWSFVHDGIQSWLFIKVRDILMKTAKSI